MNLNEYQKLALRTAPTPVGLHDMEDLQHSLYGLASEVGELADQAKRSKFYGKPLDLVNLMEEGGDCLWYLALLCRFTGINMEEMAERNIAKLAKRYPGKFDPIHATARNLQAEREVLETPYGEVDVSTHVRRDATGMRF